MNVVMNAFILAFVEGALSQPNFVQDFVRLPQKTQLKHSENGRCSGGGDSQSGNSSHHSRAVACVIKLRTKHGGKTKEGGRTYSDATTTSKYIFI